MRRNHLFLPLLIVFAAVCFAQAPVANVKVKVRAALFDRDLNLKPVPRLAVTFRNIATPEAAPVVVQTTLDGMADLQLKTGRYEVSTDKATELAGKTFLWDFETDLLKPENLVELSNDNAKITGVTGGRGARVDELADQFQRVKKSVVIVWAEDYDGDGVLVDPAGLVLTSYALVEGHDWLAVQFDETHRVAAQLLAFDKSKDVAVLRVNLDLIKEPVVAQLATDPGALVEGERVFAIKNDVDEGLMLVTGVVSKSTNEKLLADIKIPDVGAALFSSTGGVVGLAIAGKKEFELVPIARTSETLATAREKANTAPPPSARLLPCPPQDHYPVAALKGRTVTRWEKDVYYFQMGDFNVELVTPVASYEEKQEQYLVAVKERDKQLKKGRGAPAVREPEDKYPPILVVNIASGTKMNFWKSMARYNTSLPTSYRFKATFNRMRLVCGGKEVEPIWPRRVPLRGWEGRYAEIDDSTFVGNYQYPHDAISPQCGEVRLEVTSTKDTQPLVKILDPKLVNRLWQDFEPYRQAQSGAAAK